MATSLPVAQLTPDFFYSVLYFENYFEKKKWRTIFLAGSVLGDISLFESNVVGGEAFPDQTVIHFSLE
jgi:hypothetical protein